MPEFYVPDRVKPVVTRIAALSTTDFNRFLEAIRTAQPALSIDHLATEVSQALSGIEDVGEIVYTLASMNRFRLRAGHTVEQFVSEIAASVDADAEPTPSFDRMEFSERVSALLNAESLLVSVRANDLQRNHDRVFLSARVASDIRSVFDPDGNEIQGSMIVHNMHLTYLQEDEVKGFFLAMDNADITKLKRVLDRVNAKTPILLRLIEKSGSQYFE